MPNGLSRYTQAKWMSAFWEPNSTYPPTAAIARRLSGSVSVAPAGRSDRGIRIVPGQQAILGTSESLEVREVEAESYISWIHGYLPFDNDPLSNILERLSRYYNCRIECTPEAEALTLSGKLELKDDPAEVLKILSATAPINLQISGSGNFRIDYNPTTNNPN